MMKLQPHQCLNYTWVHHTAWMNSCTQASTTRLFSSNIRDLTRFTTNHSQRSLNGNLIVVNTNAANMVFTLTYFEQLLLVLAGLICLVIMFRWLVRTLVLSSLEIPFLSGDATW